MIASSCVRQDGSETIGIGREEMVGTWVTGHC